MLGKKGMSPIIATILLIAFAVALGAMIMNWSSSLVAGGALDSKCGNVQLKVRSPVCLENNQIKMDVINVGDAEIGEVIMRVKGPISDQDITIKNSHLVKGDLLTKSIPFISSDGLSVDFLVKVMAGGDEVELCEEPVYSAPSIPFCQ